MGCHAPLQVIFPIQGSNLCLLHWQAGSLPVTPPGKPCLWTRRWHLDWVQQWHKKEIHRTVLCSKEFLEFKSPLYSKHKQNKFKTILTQKNKWHFSGLHIVRAKSGAFCIETRHVHLKKKTVHWTSLVVQQLRLCIPTQEAWVRSLVREVNSTCHS